MKTYLLCDVFCLLAHFAIAFVSCRERAYWPMSYAAFCMVACGVVGFGSASAQFRAHFGQFVLPVWICGWIVFLVIAAGRFAAMPPKEFMLSAALLCGVGASIAVGFLMDRGHALYLLQMAVVVVPIVAAILAIGPRPFPGPVLAPVDFPNPLAAGAPRPMEVTL